MAIGSLGLLEPLSLDLGKNTRKVPIRGTDVQKCAFAPHFFAENVKVSGKAVRRRRFLARRIVFRFFGLSRARMESKAMLFS